MDNATVQLIGCHRWRSTPEHAKRRCVLFPVPRQRRTRTKRHPALKMPPELGLEAHLELCSRTDRRLPLLRQRREQPRDGTWRRGRSSLWLP